MVNNCNTCGSKNRKKLFTAGKYTLVRCSNCNLVYIENPLSPLSAKQDYEAENYTGSDGSASTSDYAAGEYFRTKEDNDRLDQISKIFSSKMTSILDVGCGIGFFVKAASQRGIRSVGVDISKNAVEYGRFQGLDLRETDLLSLDDFTADSFDVITFWASLAYLYYPKETLQKAHKLLRTGGIVVIETGDIGSFMAKVFRRKWRFISLYNNFYYSSSTLDDLLKRTGFKTIRTDCSGFIESLSTQFKLQKFILRIFLKASGDSKNKASGSKEILNKIAGRVKLGDVMIKYAIKV